MELLAGYNSDSGDEVGQGTSEAVAHLQPRMMAAPLTSAPAVFGALPSAVSTHALAIFDPKIAMKVEGGLVFALDLCRLSIRPAPCEHVCYLNPRTVGRWRG